MKIRSRIVLGFFSAIALLATQVVHADDDLIDSLLWDGTASNNAGRVGMAFDGDLSTRWDTGTGQKAGQWFQVNMGETRTLSRLEFDVTGSNNDYPRQYKVETSTDGTQWDPVGTGEGQVITTVAINPPKACRYFRISIPDDAHVSGGFWSIHEVRAFGPPSTGIVTPRPAIHWHVVKTQWPTREVIIAGYDITDFGINPAKDQDATTAVMLATKLLARAGGGTLWMPAGRYKISSPLKLTANVTIRGDWVAPQPGQPVQGTVLEMYANRNVDDGPSAISLSDAAALNGLTFWYPEQKADAVVPYPATVQQIGGAGMALENCTFVNTYRAFSCGPEICALNFIRNVYITALGVGIKIDGTADIGRLEHIRFSPAFWSDSGLPGAPVANGPHVAWIRNNATAIEMRRNDWSYGYDVQVDGYKIGFATRPGMDPESLSRKDKNYPNGQNARFKISNCGTAIDCENSASVGITFYDCDIANCDVGVLGQETFDKMLQFENCRIAAKTAINLLGSGQLLLTGCSIDGDVNNATGYLGLLGCTSKLATTAGTAPGIGEIRVMNQPAPPIPNDPYTTPLGRIAPPTDQVAVVIEDTFGAKGDVTTDDTDAVQKAIAAVSKSGGTVFFPPGEYRITKELSVPTGVELRGVSEGPHVPITMGSIIDVMPGRGDEKGTPFITLAAHSGVRGLVFHYPDQNTLDVAPYPWTVRGAGDSVWVIDCSDTLSYRILDLATNKCDHHFVDYWLGHALREGFRIGGGDVGGQLLNCQLNPSSYSFTNRFANSPSKMKDGNRGDACQSYAKTNADAFVLGDCTDETVFQNFVFGVNRCLVLTGSTTGASGWCLGQGGDQGRYAVWAERTGNMPLINVQVTTVDEFKGDHSYIALDPHFTGTLSILGFAAWGGPGNALTVPSGTLQITNGVISRSGGATVLQANPGHVILQNTVVNEPDSLFDGDPIGDRAILNGLFITQGKSTPPTIADSMKDLNPTLIATRIPGCVIGIPFAPEDALPTTGWTVIPSQNSNAASQMLDGDPKTRWDTGRAAQPGDEVIIDLGDVHRLTKVRIDTTASAHDFPRRFLLYLSTDGTNWGDPVASGHGEADLRIGFTPQQARYIRLVNQSGQGGFWSIHEFQVSEK